MKFIPAITTLSLMLLALGGCKESDRYTDCTQVCDRYNECVDSDSELDNCVDACTSAAEKSEDRDQQLDDCENCLDDKSCSESVFPCTAECAIFVVD